MVQHRTNFCSQQISASFWCKKFLECIAWSEVSLALNVVHSIKDKEENEINANFLYTVRFSLYSEQ